MGTYVSRLATRTLRVPVENDPQPISWADKNLKLSGLGNFQLRDKSQRTARNPKTGETAIISARRIVMLLASQKLKARFEIGRACQPYGKRRIGLERGDNVCEELAIRVICLTVLLRAHSTPVGIALKTELDDDQAFSAVERIAPWQAHRSRRKRPHGDR